jgi:hypothetical protein
LFAGESGRTSAAKQANTDAEEVEQNLKSLLAWSAGGALVRAAFL